MSMTRVINRVSQVLLALATLLVAPVVAAAAEVPTEL
jgi:hypothetical protein